MDTFMACILLWPCNFAPNGWAFCAGQILSITQNSALFALLGITFGGNGTSNFALPDMRSRIPVGVGQSTGLPEYVLGEVGGTGSVSLDLTNLPSHAHSFTISASNAQATVSIPASGTNTLAAPYDSVNFSSIAGYNNIAPDTALNVGSPNTGSAGGNVPVSVMQPYLGLNYIIALTGIFPSRG